jgi:hypothetical protein
MLGLPISSSLTPITSPAAADLAGPTHLPDSTVAQDFPGRTLRPTFLGVKATNWPAMAVAMVVMPILTVPSPTSVNQVWFSTS